MTTTPQVKKGTPLVPEVLTEEHHEALQASWELPAHDRETPREPTSRKPLYAGLIAGGLGLAIGFGAGYMLHSQTAQTVAPITISRVAGPMDANGNPLGRRVAPFDTMPPGALAVPVAMDANGNPLGRRVAPFDTMTPGALAAPAPVDANGMLLGPRVAPIE